METITFENLIVRSADQEIPRLLCKPTVHYRVHKSPPYVPILSHAQNTVSLCPIVTLSSHLHLGLLSGGFHSGFPTKTLRAFLISPTRYMSRPSHPP
jgi:hypothetical protein